MAEEIDFKAMHLWCPDIIRFQCWLRKLRQEPKYLDAGKCIRQSFFGCGIGRCFRLPPHCGRLAHHIMHQPLNLSNLILSLTHANVLAPSDSRIIPIGVAVKNSFEGLRERNKKSGACSFSVPGGLNILRHTA